ncbi:hypothetical protein [Blastomonas aquatica]|uniref:Uncharacterized protein n=1 Tax=Blastomonas aquatica TaxID=1510276 RepID=A0ABQ1JV85_9SPHN|nr:hypothetical protein [Blastomonas aquatica]GGB75513.1 hypothetical protein GCM10010833_33420 [Blastomonas aquatica]
MRVLMLEFNELSPRLMDRFISAGHLPNFERLRATSMCCVTDAEETPPNLEPWIQWVTVHTGMPFSEHKCFHLNDGGALHARRIWDDLGAVGGKSWVCGSMNAGFDKSVFRGHFLPDPWATGVPDSPDSYFRPFTDVVRTFVQEHSGRPQVSALAMARFGKFMIANGLNMDTIRATIAQLVGERRNPTKWRRALILDRLQWDLFCGVYRRERPQFASFFINSTAHFQHFHWREMEPELFKIPPREQDRDTFRDTILEGYRNMDRIVGQALALAGPDTAVMLCTALSQQPMLTYEDDHGRQIFRHRDIRQLLDFAGIDEECEYAPVMSQEFLLHCRTEAEAMSVAAKLEGLTLDDGQQVMWAAPIGLKVDAGCKLSSDPGPSLVRNRSSNTLLPFSELFYPLDALRSGMHSPDGLFWVKAPGVRPSQLESPVSLQRVHPTITHLLGLTVAPDRPASLISADEVALREAAVA